MSKHSVDHGHEMALCAYCPKMCRAVCPVGLAEARETVTTWGKMWLAYRCVEHGAAIDSEVARVFDACTGCGACTAFCEHAVDAGSALFEMRREAYAAGASPRAVVLADRFDRDGQLVDGAAAAYHNEVTGAVGPAVLLVGSAALFGRPGLAALAQRVLHDVGVQAGPLARPLATTDAGAHLLWAGLHGRFDRHAQKLCAALAQHETVVCLAPEDAYLLSVVYPHRGHRVRPRITTVIEELALRLDRIPQRPGPTLAYHDPCFLGRRLGVYSAPRRVIERVLGEPPLEFAWNREHAECVGGGGLYPHSNPAGAQAAARRLWLSRPAAATGVVTACPQAEVELHRAGALVLDVVELVAGVQLATRAAPAGG